ncbi:MAG: hypothetical protein PGN12_08110 [Sphingomonas phyllosphaerae]
METVISHLRAQADRYSRLARHLDSRGDSAFLNSMAAGYRARAERAAAVVAEFGA